MLTPHLRRSVPGILIATLCTTLAPAVAQESGQDTDSLTVRYRAIADRIIAATLDGNDAWNKMEELCDGIGHRLSGSMQLEQAVRWCVKTMKRDGQENVRAEPVMVPHWVRGKESLAMVEPRPMVLSMLGLGGSIATPPGGVTAEVIVVADKDELDRVSDKAKGKIVLFNFPMAPYSQTTGTHYGQAVRYRGNGAVWAAQSGAVAALVRSVTAHSLNTPHTGAMHYRDGVAKIPTAAVTVENADMIDRLFRRGVTVRVNLKMQAKTLPDALSANVIGELRGSTNPEEVVVIGGHLDSWDVGSGAHDDAGGCVISMEAINVLRKLNLRPRRTIRVVLFTNEENGLAGGKQYAKEHEQEMKNHVAAIESDGGVFAPTGFGITIPGEAGKTGEEAAEQKKRRQGVARARLEQITRLLTRLGTLNATNGGGGADIGPMSSFGVPMLSHRVDMSTYFDHHHTRADTLDKVSPEDLSKNVAAMAVMAYVLADMPGRIHDEPTKP